MPIYEYECENHHRTEVMVLPKVDVVSSEARPASVKCKECGLDAEPAPPSRVGANFDMFFGSRYGFAGPKTRDAWHKHPTVTEWVGPGT